MCVHSFTLVDPNTTGVIEAWKVFSLFDPEGSPEVYVSPLSAAGPYQPEEWYNARNHKPSRETEEYVLAPLQGSPVGFMAYTSRGDAIHAAMRMRIENLVVRKVKLFGVIAVAIDHTKTRRKIYVAHEMLIPCDQDQGFVA